jgi:exopolysaccharide biosynthesis polyprenyl glycosylphosphotransferase
MSAAEPTTRAAPKRGPQPASALDHVGRPRRRRGWLVRRMLLGADIAGLTLAFLVTELLIRIGGWWAVDLAPEVLLFVITLPTWIVVAKVYGLYDRDDERTDHSTVEDAVDVFHLVTVGAWLLFVGTWLTGLANPPLSKLFAFWALALAFIMVARSVARTLCHRSATYLQNALIVGAGDVGQLIARKFRQHSEYGINLVGFVDAQAKELRADVASVPILGPPDDLLELVGRHEVDRVVVSFSNDTADEMLSLVRSLRDLDVQVDIVPRLFEVVGPSVGIHTVEGLALIGLPPVKLSRSSRLLKRTMDVFGATIALVATAPLIAYIAWRIKRGSRGPVFFRQTRLGQDMREFTSLKFRTMKVGTDDSLHREYIKATMSARTELGDNGIYKLDRGDAVTPFGRWLRETSLDELPQLINVLRGDMSLVGPRPCIPYETEHFAPHHFERFLVPAGLTGLWQVTARAHSTFGEALDMDVAYARGWSLGLDLRLLFRTPLQVIRRRGTA